MIRLTTPTHKFTFPTDPEDYDEILITYVQNNTIILEKEKSDMTFGENNIAQYQLTQAETALFKAGTVQMQARVLTEDGVALASKVFTMNVEDVLNKEILT